MHDNKLRLSQDVISKAEEIASEWGLKNARAAVEAVFRKYADDYQYGRVGMPLMLPAMVNQPMMQSTLQSTLQSTPMTMPMTLPRIGQINPLDCKAANELDGLLGL
jgi:hypothetical protein